MITGAAASRSTEQGASIRRAGAERLIVIFNRDDTERTLQLELPGGRKFSSIDTWTDGTPAASAAEDSRVSVRIPPHRVAAVHLSY